MSIGPVAQLVEQFPFKEEVLGPNPSRVTKQKSLFMGVFLFLARSDQTALVATGMRTPERCRATQDGERDREAVARQNFRKKILVEAESLPALSGQPGHNTKNCPFRALFLCLNSVLQYSMNLLV